MSAKFPEYKGLDLPDIAQKILQYWEKHAIFEKSISPREGQPPYVFFEGPPSANGLPGVHHVLARAIKDIFPRPIKTPKIDITTNIKHITQVDDMLNFFLL